jgi:hypothetical protein
MRSMGTPPLSITRLFPLTSFRNTEYMNSHFQSPLTQQHVPHQPASPSPASDQDEDLRLALAMSKIDYDSATPQSQPIAPVPSSPSLVGYARPPPSDPSPRHQIQESYSSPLHQPVAISPTHYPSSPHSSSFSAPAFHLPNHGSDFKTEQEEADRLHALALQEEYRWQIEDQYIPPSEATASAGSSPSPAQNAEMILGKKIDPEQLERYKQAEREYLSSLQQTPQQPPRGQRQQQGRQQQQQQQSQGAGVCNIQ